MENKEFLNIGEQIRETVQGAIDSMDFKQLNHVISNTVDHALDEARTQLTERSAEWKSSLQSSVCRESKAPIQADAAEENTNSRNIIVRYRGRLKSILYILSGGAGLGITTPFLISAFLVWGISGSAGVSTLGLLIFLTILEILFSIMFVKGNLARRRLKRLKIYLKQAEGKAYCQIQTLALKIGKSKQYVIKDLNKMIRYGILPEAHIDEQKTCLMLNTQMYLQYQETQQALKARQLLEAQRFRESKETVNQERAGDQGELSQVIAAGRNYLRILREANASISGEVISAKLYRLEKVVGKIFESVEHHPEQIEEMQKFMDYYLPTTVKLVKAYRDFDRVEITGGNIAMAKCEIQETIDTINQAFERFLDDLYQNAALDASTDASVLQTMLRKEGWTENDFNRRPTP